jgi:hypothetical protein
MDVIEINFALCTVLSISLFVRVCNSTEQNFLKDLEIFGPEVLPVMKLKGSLLCSQDPTIGTDCEQFTLNPHPRTLFLPSLVILNSQNNSELTK